ncbi:hypothetical protein [Propionispora vibrioides]|jgi:hypothetical protein|uniref:DUF2878 domain-containing protein n=1 Tax=Propionispora vibrioides TaxID=112903 RepID=A0A1H8SE96_9FIRM|nr:hypothetical protein [Propionispora vibrioides]SEO76826.1 hypothetical protein SAMN04490178_10513 [Propionispora vibrioides]
MDKSYLYIILTAITGFGFLLLIPKHQYKRYFLYGVVLGGLVDIAIVLTLTLLGQVRYANMGHFSAFGLIHAFAPVSWSFTFAMFLYFLPKRTTFFWLYIFAFAVLNLKVATIMQSFDTYGYSNAFVLTIVFLLWGYGAAYVYRRDPQIKLLHPVLQKPLKKPDNDD